MLKEYNKLLLIGALYFILGIFSNLYNLFNTTIFWIFRPNLLLSVIGLMFLIAGLLKMPRKIDKTLISLIILEILAVLAILAFIEPLDCGSPCDNHSLLNPFSMGGPAFCAHVCVPQTIPHVFYPAVDLLILTTLAYIFYLIIGKRNKK